MKTFRKYVKLWQRGIYITLIAIMAWSLSYLPTHQVLAVTEDTGLCSDALDVMFVLDGSGSMVGDPFANTQAAAQGLLGLLGTQDRAGLIVFGNNPHMGDSYGGLPLTSDLTAVSSAIGATAPVIGAGTNIGDSLFTAIGELNAKNTGARPIIVLVSDGQPTMPSWPPNSTEGNDLPQVQAAIVNAAGVGIEIYTFAMNPTATQWEDLMEQIATDTSGTYSLGGPADIQSYFTQVLPGDICGDGPACGNGIYENPPEECDNGEGNKDGMKPVWSENQGDGDRTYCSTQCTIYDVPGVWCGDGVKNGPEECDGDDGVGEGQYCTKGCTLDDIPVDPFCGDGEVNQEWEQCDDGNNDNGDGCSERCQIEEEQCEPGPVELVNGSCEEPVVTHEKLWDIFSSVPGWTLAWESTETNYNNATRPEDALLEFHRGVAGWQPAEGQQHCELDTDWVGPDGGLSGEPASVSMSQQVSTFAGATYQLSYAFSPRPNQGSEENILSVRINGTEVNQRSAPGGGDVDWNYYTEVFTADSDTTTIEFADIGVPNSLGTFLDDISLELLECPGEPTGTITICKQHDLNGDGILDDDEPLVPDWNFYLDDTEYNSGDQCAVIKDLPYGEYTINEEQVDGWFQTGASGNGTLNPDGSVTVVVGEENSVPIVYFLNVEADIWGCKYDDQENKLGGWQIDLYRQSIQRVEKTSGDSLESLEPQWGLYSSTYTEDNPEWPQYGCYYFFGLDYDGDWFQLREVNQENWEQVSPLDPDYYEFYFDDPISEPFDFINEYNKPEDGPGGGGTCISNCGGSGTRTTETTSTPTSEPIVLGYETVLPELTKSVDQSSVNPGGVLTYTLNITNSGEVDIVDAVLTDTLPAGFTFVENGAIQKTWDIGTITAGDTLTFVYDVNIADGTAAGIYANTAKLAFNYSNEVSVAAAAAGISTDVFTIAAVQTHELIAEAQVEVVPVKVAGYEALPETGGPQGYGWLGAMIGLFGFALMRRYGLEI